MLFVVSIYFKLNFSKWFRIFYILEQTDYTLVWSRVRAPGKKTIWTKIVENLYSLGLNPHDLEFVQQLDCKIPSLNQYDEMFFC